MAGYQSDPRVDHGDLFRRAGHAGCHHRRNMFRCCIAALTTCCTRDFPAHAEGPSLEAIMGRNQPNWAVLRATTTSWIDVTLRRLRKQIAQCSRTDELVLRTAQFCLMKGREYVAAAFDDFEAGRFSAGLACTRVAYETAVTFLWASLEGKSEDRLRAWRKDYFRQRKNLADAMQDMYPEDKSDWQRRAAECEGHMVSIETESRMPGFAGLTRQIRKEIPDEARVHAGFLYPLYRVLSGSAHAELDMERYFASRAQATVTSRPEMPPYAPWVIFTSALWLVYGPRACLNWRREELMRDYAEVVGPLRRA